MVIFVDVTQSINCHIQKSYSSLILNGSHKIISIPKRDSKICFSKFSVYRHKKGDDVQTLYSISMICMEIELFNSKILCLAAILTINYNFLSPCHVTKSWKMIRQNGTWNSIRPRNIAFWHLHQSNSIACAFI